MFAKIETVVRYSWTCDQRDLDTATQFINGTVGCGGGLTDRFMLFGGYNTTLGGMESTVARFEAARRAGPTRRQ